MPRYTCPQCGTESHELSCDAEATQLLATHQQVRHGNLNRSEPRPARTTTPAVRLPRRRR